MKSMSFFVVLSYIFLTLESVLPVAQALQTPSRFVPSQSFENGVLKPGADNSEGNSHFHPTKSPLVSPAPKAGSPSQQRSLQ